MFEEMLAAGLRIAEPINIAMLLLGSLLGVVFGALPGLGTLTALGVALPFTYGMDSIPAMLLYAGIISSGTFGGSVPAILINTPGTGANACTCLDGYPMAQNGEAGRALAISATSCFIGSTGGVFVTIALIPVVKPIVYAFGPPEFFWMIMFGLIMIAFASKGHMLKGLVGGALGILLSMIGYTEMFAEFRFTMGSDYLWDGIPTVPFLVGIFAISELIRYTAQGGTTANITQAEKTAIT